MVEGIQMLLDIEALRTLKAKYCYYVDYEDWAGLKNLFHEDAVVEIVGQASRSGVAGNFDGRDEFVKAVVTHHTEAVVRTVHQCHEPIITFQSDDSACATWSMFDFVDRLWVSDGLREAFQGFGHYRESYVRGAVGEWKIVQMQLTRIRVDWLDPLKLGDFPHRVPDDEVKDISSAK